MQTEISDFFSDPTVRWAVLSVAILAGVLLALKAISRGRRHHPKGLSQRSGPDERLIVRLGHFEMTLAGAIVSLCVLVLLLLAIYQIDRIFAPLTHVKTAAFPPASTSRR